MTSDKIRLLITSPQSALEKELGDSFPLIDYTLKSYQNGEIDICIKESLENQKLFLIHFTDHSLHDSLMVLLLIIHAAKSQKASQIHVVLPSFPYNRQNHIKTGLPPIALIARLLESAGATSITTVDLHDPHSINFFRIPVHHLSFESTIVADIMHRHLSNFVIVSPDKGGIPRAKSLADQLHVPFVSLDKKRNGPGDSKILGINGDVTGKLCLIFDDIIDSGNTIFEAVETLLEKGAERCEAYVTHSFLTLETAKRIQDSRIDRLTLSDTSPPSLMLPSKICTLSINQEIINFIKKTGI